MIDINEKICTYITKNWLIPWLKENKSQNSFAKNHDIEESTVRKIKSDTTYRIPVETLYKICNKLHQKANNLYNFGYNQRLWNRDTTISF
jgi:DNA-binding Xre family transcriptional regulator